MTGRLERAVAAIARLREEFTLDELQSALSKLHQAALTNVIDTKAAESRRGKRKPVERSLALMRLEKSDPTKFAYLAKLEKRLRSRELLPNASELLQFCRSVDKDFYPRKKRDEAVSAVMMALSEMPLDDLEERVPQALEATTAGDTDAYHRLARELMGGKRRSDT